MRQVFNKEMQLGEISIKDIKLDLRSRDEIPKILKGLQDIYCNDPIRDSVLKYYLK